MSLENFQKIYRTNVIDVVNYLRDKTGYFLVSDNSEIRSEIKITLFYKGMCQVSWISEEIIKGKRKPLSLKEFDQEKKILNTKITTTITSGINIPGVSLSLLSPQGS